MNAQEVFNIDGFEYMRKILTPVNGIRFEGIYRGIVTRCKLDAAKPLWVKVKIFGLTDEIPAKNQPWARGSGTHSVPEAGTYVDIVFENGDIHFPIWSNPSKGKNGKLVTRGQKQSNQKNQEIYNSQDGTSIEYNKKSGDFVISHSSGAELKIDKSGKTTIMSGPGGIPLPQYSVLTEATICPFTKTFHFGGTEYLKVPALPGG